MIEAAEALGYRVNHLARQLREIMVVLNAESGEASVDRALRLTLYCRADATLMLSVTPSSALVLTALANGQQVNRSSSSVVTAG